MFGTTAQHLQQKQCLNNQPAHQEECAFLADMSFLYLQRPTDLLCSMHTALSASQYQKYQCLLMDWIFSVLVQRDLLSQLLQSLISLMLRVEQLLHKLEQYLVKYKENVTLKQHRYLPTTTQKGVCSKVNMHWTANTEYK